MTTNINKRLKKGKHLMEGKRTKLRGLPLAQQPRDVPPKVVRKSLPTMARHEEKPRLPITEGQWKIND